ncbi:MAG: hypothetical protein J6573_07020 [Lactobacillus sp.]|nr:hypothetical protein [Lactobacillus sp.]
MILILTILNILFFLIIVIMFYCFHNTSTNLTNEQKIKTFKNHNIDHQIKNFVIAIQALLLFILGSFCFFVLSHSSLPIFIYFVWSGIFFGISCFYFKKIINDPMVNDPTINNPMIIKKFYKRLKLRKLAVNSLGIESIINIISAVIIYILY